MPCSEISLASLCRETGGLQENSPPRLRRGCGAKRHRGGTSCRNSDTGLAFPELFEPPRRGLWLPLLIQGGEFSCRVLRQKLAKRIAIFLLFVSHSFVLTLQAIQAPDAKIQALVAQGNVNGLKRIGPAVLPALAQLYESSKEGQRATIAWMFYELGWKSPEAKKVLMRDVQTQNSKLRLQVQWALGRVSNDDDVVEVLLNNMQNDSNPLFRDKAACALANDQIHLTKKQKARLFEGLIHALGDPKVQVRSIALLALQIQTGQTKNFNPNGSSVEREASIQEWKRWLEEYKSQL